MWHGYAFSKLGRDSLLRQRAKAMRKIGDKMITLGKAGTQEAKSEAWRWMRERPLVSKIFGSLRERYQDRAGGYTRVLRVPNRKGDNAPMAIIELVDNNLPPLRPPRTHASSRANTASN
ncbi:hypothetical protein EMCRGX_G011078 [Ephydatia muelleri]